MPTMQIRDVPVEVSRVLKARAAAAGQSLSDYLLVELTRIAERPTAAEIDVYKRQVPTYDPNRDGVAAPWAPLDP